MKKFLAFFFVLIFAISTVTCASAATRDAVIVSTTRHSNACLYNGASESSGIAYNLSSYSNTSIELLFHKSNIWWPYGRVHMSDGSYIIGRIPIYQFDYSPNLMIASLLSYSTLVKGDRGTAVENLQYLLNRVNCNAGTEDGIWGTNTTNAVKAFQSANGLTVDGKVGPATKLKLLKASGFISSSWNY